MAIKIFVPQDINNGPYDWVKENCKSPVRIMGFITTSPSGKIKYMDRFEFEDEAEAEAVMFKLRWA